MDFQKLSLRDGTILRAPMRVPVEGGSKGVGQVGYQVFLQENTRGIQLHMEAIARATRTYFGDCITVLHPFGGLGMAAQCMDTVAGKQFEHEFWERDTHCVTALKELYPKCDVRHVDDSFKELLTAKLGHFDIVYLDPTAMTCKKDHLWQIWDRLTGDNGPAYIWFVDSAISKIWLHTKTYSEFFGTPIRNIHDYFHAYDDKLRKLGLQIYDLTREGTVVYGVVGAIQVSDAGLQIVDLRLP